jgi:hypothetical protein
LGFLFRTRSVERDLDEELRFHLDLDARRKSTKSSLMAA